MDVYWRAAKREGYRSRAAFKLLEINERFRLFRPNDTVLDLGAAPGGWSQVAIDAVDPGSVIAVDLDRIDNIPGVVSIRGDIFSDETVEKVASACTGSFDVVLSDMAPNISGAYSTDHARSIALAERARDIAFRLLKRSGRFVVKVFDGDLLWALLESLRSRFKRVQVHKPRASRKGSSEIYVVCIGYVKEGSLPKGRSRRA
jgi:23S rRNA (uridine2552-2'-O)-methyltransferase